MWTVFSNLKAGVHMKAVVWLGFIVLMRISRLRFNQSKQSSVNPYAHNTYLCFVKRDCPFFLCLCFCLCRVFHKWKLRKTNKWVRSSYVCAYASVYAIVVFACAYSYACACTYALVKTKTWWLLGVFGENVFLKGLVKFMGIGNFEDLVLF